MNEDQTLAPEAMSSDLALQRLAWTAVGTASLAAILLLFRPYFGIVHDSGIYIGRALGQLDPSGIGQDFMFARDGQSEFSAFPLVIALLVRLLGPSPAAILLTLAGLVLWVCAAGGLLQRLATGRALWAAMACLLALPQTYGGLGVFGYAEAFASPRVFAEAGVLAALGALLAGRKVAGLALLAAAAAVHPLMALPGAAVGLVLLAYEDRRWLYAAAAAGLAVLGAAALGLPLAGRLFQPIDPDWMRVLIGRNTYLFPLLWLADDYGTMAVRAVTLLIGAGFLEGRARVLAFAVLGVGGAGLAASILFGQLWPSVLITQLQLWRSLWLLSVLSNALLPLAVVGLWRGGAAFRPAAAALVLAWLSSDAPLPALLLSAAAGLLFAAARRGRLPTPSPLIQKGLLWAVAAVAAFGFVRRGVALSAFLQAGVGAGAPIGWGQVLASDLPAMAVAALAVAVAAHPPRRMGRAALAALAATILALVLWDIRAPARRMVDERRGLKDLTALVADSPGAVLWTQGDTQPWLLMGRPGWGGTIQGAGAVFSRPLAMQWSERLRAEIGLGLADRRAMLPPTASANVGPRSLIRPTLAGLTALCRRPDAPGVIVLAGDAPPGVASRTWRPSAAQYVGYVDGSNRWQRVDRYALVSCRSLEGASIGLRP